MIGIGGSGVISLVARVAVGRRPREDVIDVAAEARNGEVRPSQGEGRLAVVEGCPRPISRRMADTAIGRETGRHMIGVVRALVVGQVTGHASG